MEIHDVQSHMIRFDSISIHKLQLSNIFPAVQNILCKSSHPNQLYIYLSFLNGTITKKEKKRKMGKSGSKHEPICLDDCVLVVAHRMNE